MDLSRQPVQQRVNYTAISIYQYPLDQCPMPINADQLGTINKVQRRYKMESSDHCSADSLFSKG